MRVRINKLLSETGIASRREVEDYILDGRVCINGREATLSDTVGADDEVLLDGVDLPVRDLLIEMESLDQYEHYEIERFEQRNRKQSRMDERRESQRIAAAPKSAANRKTSKNHPDNKKKFSQSSGGKYGFDDHDYDDGKSGIKRERQTKSNKPRRGGRDR